MALYYDKYVRFDWAMKRLLRNKTNHAVLEGLLLSLIGKKIVIKHFLESEGKSGTVIYFGCLTSTTVSIYWQKTKTAS